MKASDEGMKPSDYIQEGRNAFRSGQHTPPYLPVSAMNGIKRALWMKGYEEEKTKREKRR